MYKKSLRKSCIDYSRYFSKKFFKNFSGALRTSYRDSASIFSTIPIDICLWTAWIFKEMSPWNLSKNLIWIPLENQKFRISSMILMNFKGIRKKISKGIWTGILERIFEGLSDEFSSGILVEISGINSRESRNKILEEEEIFEECPG